MNLNWAIDIPETPRPRVLLGGFECTLTDAEHRKWMKFCHSAQDNFWEEYHIACAELETATHIDGRAARAASREWCRTAREAFDAAEVWYTELRRGGGSDE